MSETMNPQTALAKITEAAANPNEDVRDLSCVEVGKAARQGDVYLGRLPDGITLPGEPHNGSQLVTGQTLGSRHVVTGDAMLRASSNGKAKGGEPFSTVELWCPDIEVGTGGATLTHPEHADCKLPPNSRWVAWQQMDEKTRERVAD